MSAPGELLRATIFHTPGNALQTKVLKAYRDGGLLIRDGRIAACDDYETVRAIAPEVPVRDLRGGFLLPGFIDTHVHFPQVRVIGSLGKTLLQWLEESALPEESRMADTAYAAQMARVFIKALASNGTTTALVFGSHFRDATACLFEEAGRCGLRVVSGLVVSDRCLRPDLHRSPEAAHRDSVDLIQRFHGKGRLLYAVTPRFAMSASEPMLEVCQSLVREHSGLRIQSHLNENRDEIAEVRKLFAWAPNYFGVYERFGLCGRGAVMAHNVHPSPAELQQLSSTGTAVAHCPSSNAALGSGLFPLRSHVEAGIRCALGTDVGAGVSFSVLREGLQAYLMQRLLPEGMILNGASLLYLATRAGAEALQLESETGDFEAGKAADFAYLRPVPDTPLAANVEHADDLDKLLTVLFTLGSADCVREVQVEGTVVYSADPR